MTLPHGHPPEEDWDLEHPRCVYQVTKRHFARYTPEMVERICGVPRAQFLRVAEWLCENSGRERTSAIAYAVGWTQHSHGVQNIRAASILQLLLGNVGRPGGGVMALRGHANIQGSTDIRRSTTSCRGTSRCPIRSRTRRSTRSSRRTGPTRGRGARCGRSWSAC
jgi:formate dehydrogenase major subunit